MKLKLLKNMFKGRFEPKNILKIYNISGIIEVIHEDHFNTLLIRKVYHKNRIFNIKDYKEKILSKIYSFYEVLNDVATGESEYGESKNGLDKLFLLLDLENLFEYGSQSQEYIGELRYQKEKNKIRYGWGRSGEWYLTPEIDNPMKGQGYCLDESTDEIVDVNDFTREGHYLCFDYLTVQEFYLLIQIYLGLYQEGKYKKEMEENVKNNDIEELKKEYFILRKELEQKKKIELEKYKDIDYPKKYEYIRKVEETLSEDLLGKDKGKKYDYLYKLIEEYLKLQLMKKDISGAFDGLKIEKIYDKDWSEEKQREHIEEINKEFGEEVIVEE